MQVMSSTENKKEKKEEKKRTYCFCLLWQYGK